MAYITPSITPHDGLNPAYRVYYTDSSRDSSTHLVLDHATYSVDLEIANTLPISTPLSYTLEYTARGSLGLQDLSPGSWDEFVQRLVREPEVWGHFYRRYSRGGPHAKKDCGKACKEHILCRLVTFDRDNTNQCNMIKNQMKRIEKEKTEKEEKQWSVLDIL